MVTDISHTVPPTVYSPGSSITASREVTNTPEKLVLLLSAMTWPPPLLPNTKDTDIQNDAFTLHHFYAFKSLYTRGYLAIFLVDINFYQCNVQKWSRSSQTKSPKRCWVTWESGQSCRETYKHNPRPPSDLCLFSPGERLKWPLQLGSELWLGGFKQTCWHKAPGGAEATGLSS